MGLVAPQRTSPVLPTLSFTVQAHPGVTFYGSYVRGLEDSVSAPPNAANRGEPPPATSSWQVDGGVRFVMSNYFDLVFGGFDVQKPYFNLDPNDNYRQLGRIENRGIEASATLRPADGLKVVAGYVHNNPHVNLRAAGPTQQLARGTHWASSVDSQCECGLRADKVARVGCLCAVDLAVVPC